VLVNVVFGIATIASFIILFRKLQKDGDRLLFALGSVALIASVGCYGMKYIDSRSFSEQLHASLSTNEVLTQKYNTLAHDVQFAKAVAVMHMGGSL
jgi:hypothetical protein